MAGRRLTRKEIVQEDQIHSTINQIFTFVLEKKELLLITLASAVALALAIYFFLDYQTGKKSEIQLAFSNAVDIYNGAVGEAPAAEPGAPPDTRPRFKTENEKYAAALKAFETLKENGSGSAIGEYSTYYAALCQKGLGRREEFVKTMEQLAGSGSGEVPGLADYALGEYFLSSGDAEKGLSYLEKLLKNAASNLPKDSILTDLGDYYEKRGMKDKAKETYERILKDYPDTRKQATVRARLSALNPAEKK